jgi:hypothetical protein
MAKRTILQLVQQLGESIGSDEIDTLDETIEASEIATILEQTVTEVISRKRWEFIKDRVRQLDIRDIASTQLNTLVIPSDVTRINCLKYRDTNNADVTTFIKLTYMQPCEFIEFVQARNSADSNITAIANDDGVLINVLTDNAPTRWTSFDEENITFDAYDATLGTGNLIADSVIIADIVPVIDYTDATATLKVPERMETLIYNEAVSTCAIRLRQTVDPKAERVARRQHIALREQEHITNKDIKEANYARRSRSGR